MSKNYELGNDEENFILEEYYGKSITSSSVYKFHAWKCISFLNEILWGMISEIFSEKVFDYKSYTDKITDKYNKQLNYFNSLRI